MLQMIRYVAAFKVINVTDDRKCCCILSDECYRWYEMLLHSKWWMLQIIVNVAAFKVVNVTDDRKSCWILRCECYRW